MVFHAYAKGLLKVQLENDRLNSSAKKCRMRLSAQLFSSSFSSPIVVIHGSFFVHHLK